MYKTNIVKRALYLRKGERERGRERGVFGAWITPGIIRVYLSLSCFSSEERERENVAVGRPLVQVRNETNGEEEEKEEEEYVLRRRPPDAGLGQPQFPRV